MTIQKTTDYKKFKRIKGNRGLNKSHATRLATSLAANPDFLEATPILVNEKFEVVDGQHRLAAAEQLGVSIYYRIMKGLGLKDVQRINSATKTWSPLDFAECYAELGDEHYKKYLEFKSRYLLPHTVLVMYLTVEKNQSSGQSMSRAFNAGRFKIIDEELSTKLLDQLCELGEHTDQYRTKGFACAFMRIALHPDYDHERMIEQIDRDQRGIKESKYIEDYMRSLERIYNYRYNMGAGRVKLF